MLLLKQTCAILSTYAADVSGVCSALYEMGGMTVMHDASGCNSTYNTHDEPRWYDMPSMVFISALAEVDAVMGDDEKLIGDVCRAAEELRPRFVALAGTPIPMMMGTDFKGVARLIESRTGIPTFGFATNGMHSYNKGASTALAAVAERFCDPSLSRRELAAEEAPEVNLLGVTPLDFSVTGNVEAMKKSFVDAGFRVNSCWAMGDGWERLMEAGRAHVNVVVSSCGEGLAKVLREKYAIPAVTGIPIGAAAQRELFDAARAAARDGNDRKMPAPDAEGAEFIVVGEPVQSAEIARALHRDFGIESVGAISPLDFPDEDKIFAQLKNARTVIADPLYKPALPKGCRFLSLPHEGYSGRIFRNQIPLIMGGNFNEWIKKELSL